MSVFKSLTEEHALLLNLIGRLERAATNPDLRCASRDTRNLLLVLLKALEAHESLEHLVFDPGPEPPSAPKGAALALVERQHRALAALRAEATELLQGLPREDAASIRGLAQRLTHLLRRHFKYEERLLWPNFNASTGRSRLNSLDRLARAQLRAMTKELDSYLTAVESYLT